MKRKSLSAEKSKEKSAEKKKISNDNSSDNNHGKEHKKTKTNKSAKKSNKRILNKVLKTALKVFLVFFIVLSVIFIAAQTVGGVTLKTIVSEIKIAFSNIGFGSGYPYQYSAENERIFINGSKVLVFNENKTMLLSKSAKNLAEIPVEYGRPAIDYYNGKAIIYDRESGRFRIQSCSDIIYEGDIADKIISTASISKNGSCALAYTDENYHSYFEVFDKSQKSIFLWKFSGERVTCIDISDDSKYAVVSTILSKDAVVSSKVYVFRFDSEEYISCFDFNKCTIVDVSYNGNHDISVISDKNRYYIEDNSTLCDPLSFNSDVLYKCTDNKSTLSAVALKKYGGNSFGTVKVFSGKDFSFSIDTDKEIKGVSCSGKNIAVLTSDAAILYNNEGTKISEIKLESSYDDIALNGKTAFLVNSVSVNCIKFK